MRILTHTVTAGEDGLTVRQLLRSLWHIDHSLLSRLKFRDAITLNGAPVTVRAVAHTGDLLCADVSDPPGENPHIQPVDYPLTVLYEDEDLLLLDKPAGIAIHPAALTEETATIAGAVAHYLQSDSFHAVNRLDRGTTGVMAVAKTGFVHARCMPPRSFTKSATVLAQLGRRNARLPGSPKCILMATYFSLKSISPMPAVFISRVSFCCKFS